MIRKYLDKLLIALGCVVIIAAVVVKFGTQYQQKKLIDDYRAYVSEMHSQDKIYNEESQLLSEDIVALAEHITKYENQEPTEDIIGILSIPKIDLTVGIGEGVDATTLKYSVGHFPETAMPGQKGNLCLTGHRSYAFGQFFNRLDELEKNDEIIIESKGITYKYIVTQSKVVKPEEVSVLDQSEDSQITLITCTPIRVGSHRLVVKGVLVE
jgi:sortase A